MKGKTKKLLCALLLLTLLSALLAANALASPAPGTMEIPSGAEITEVGTWAELRSGITAIKTDGDYYFKITADLTADSTIKLPGGTAKIEYAVYIYCAADHSIGRAVTFSDPMFIMGNNGPCNAVVTLAFGGINGGSLTISDSGVISTGVIYGYGGIGANSAVELYDGVVFEGNEISNSLWEFAGWKADNGTIYTSDELANLNIEQDSTFTAQYVSKNQETYIVSFDRGTTQGSITGDTEFNIPSGESLSSMNYAVPGHSTFGTVEFDCWEDSYGNYYTSEQIAALEITQDMSFIARWKLNTGKISIYFKNEYLDYPSSYNDWSFINIQTGSKLDSSNPPKAEQRNGYEFIGWMSTNGTFYTHDQLMDKVFNHTESFVAKFERNDGKVAVSFDGGTHGSVSSNDIILSKGSTIAGSGETIPTVKPDSATTGGTLIYTIGSSTVVRMYGGKIRNNTSNSSLGGMINTNNFEMSGGKISGNTVIGSTSTGAVSGGGVNCKSAKLTGGEISGNTVQCLSDTGLPVGGGLYIETSTIEDHMFLSGCKISGNKTIGPDGELAGEGGGICFWSSDHDDTVQITLSDIEISGNSSGFGGGISCTNHNPKTSPENYSALILSDGCVIDGNTAQYAGGGVHFWWETSSLKLDGGEITNNKVLTYEESAPYRQWTSNNFSGLCGGGGIMLGTDSGTHYDGWEPASFIMTSGTISGNTSNTNGGGIAADVAVAIISGGTIVDNTAAGNGGGLYWHSAENNRRESNVSYDITLSGAVQISRNKAENGGGVYLLGEDVNPDAIKFLSLTIGDSVQITDNEAAANGGGVYCGRSDEDIARGRPSYVYVTGGSITGNTAGNAGGGIYNTGAAIISGGAFDNTATGLPTSSEVYHSGITMPEYDSMKLWRGIPDDSLVLSGSVDLSGGVYLDTDHVIDVVDGFSGKATVDVRKNDKDPDNVDGTYQAGRDVIEFESSISDESAAIALFPLANEVSSSFRLVKAADANNILELKPPITITPASITIYMGGTGYAGAVDVSGNTIDADSGFPEPGFLLTLPESVQDVNKLRLVYTDEETIIYQWKFEMYGEGAEKLYRIVPDGNTPAQKVRMQFTTTDGTVVSDDSFEFDEYLNQTLTMKVYGEGIDAGKVSFLYDNNTTYAIAVGEDAELTVRGTTENAVYSPVNAEPEEGAPRLEAEEGTVYYINGGNVQVADAGGVALLFDDIIETDGEDTNKGLLRDRALDELGEGEWSFEYKYLDLVDTANGNAWVKASEDVTVCWPRPKDAPADAEFVLLHFDGLDREMGTDNIGSNIAECEVQKPDVALSEDGEYLVFTVEPGGFSPFVLAWTASDTPNIPPVYVPGGLNTEDHFGYIIGYEDGTIRPRASITRAETATIFFRLLTDEARAEFWTDANEYTDVSSADWFNSAVSTLSNMGILGGYEDGTFRPNATITRAEFAKIAVSFFEYEDIEAENIFTDVAEGSWYENFVAVAAEIGLIEGYEGSVFRPDESITRAEACTIINRTLGRAPDKEHLLPEAEMNVWPDNTPEDWFYADMQEATNSHEYRWLGDIEQWLEKLPERDWDALQ